MGLITNFVNKLIDLKLKSEANSMPDVLNQLEPDEAFRALENWVQYHSDTSELIYFYKTNFPKKNVYYDQHLFWRDVVGNIPIQHFPLAQIITQTMVDLVFHDEPKFNVLNQRGKVDKKTQQIVDDVFNENEIFNLLKEAATKKSYSGVVCLVPIIDETFSDKVIWKSYPKEQCHCNRKYGRVEEAVVYDEYWQTEGSKKIRYVLETTYGQKSITYHLYDYRNESKPIEVELVKLYETSNLSNMEISKQDGSSYPLFVWLDNNLDGTSDYKNLYDDFAALDEIYSAITDLVRKGHIKNYVPASMVKKRTQDDITLMPDDFSENVVKIPMANPTNAPYKIERDTILLQDNISSLSAVFNDTRLHALLAVGLSPATVGVNDGGANQSSLALNIRERASMRTRARSMKQWSNALEKMVKITIALSTATSIKSEGEATPSKLLIPDFKGQVSIDFPEYESPSFDQKVVSLRAALDANLIDRETALKQLYPDKDDNEIQIMLIAITSNLPLEEAAKVLEDETIPPVEEKTDEEQTKDEENE